jgi:VCBS repeat-containing protein/parallel beta-helix repeat protein
MADIILNNPSASAAENVERIKVAIANAHKAYMEDTSPNKVPVKVILGEGTWLVTGDKNNESAGAIELLSGVELTGSGNRGTVIQLEDNFNARINGIVRTALTDVENVKISNLVIDGNRDKQAAGSHQAGFICGVKDDPEDPAPPSIQRNITIDGVEVKDCTAYGFNPHETTYNMVIRNSIAHNNGLDGFVADAVIGGTYENNVSYDNDRHGFNIQNATQNLILKNNEAYDNGFRYINKDGEFSGGAGLTIQRGNIPPEGSTTIPWVSDILISGGKYHGNNKEGILVKLSDSVTIDDAEVYGNLRQGVRIEGSTNTVLKNSTIYNNSQELHDEYDEVNIRLRSDYEDGNAKQLPKTYYSTGTQIIDNTIYSDGAIKARWGIREEPTNDDGGATGTVATGNTISGMASGSISIPGESNPVIGTSGDDTLTGTTGADEMTGFAGNDTYTVNHSGDVVTEVAGEGNDTVQASISHTLSANVENLILTGPTAVNGDGNTLDNVLIGNAASNRLKGNLGNDTLDGGGGADTLDGGDGNDTYYVDSSDDIIIEKDHLGAGGIDSVFSTASVALSAEVENLTLLGSAHINATGNTQANLLTGNAGNNILNGGTGSDVMTGGLGDDTYYVDHTGDVVVEKPGEGIDRVNSYISYTIRDDLEHLTLLEPVTAGAGAIVGTGNAVNNAIVGNSLANKLNGAGGDDTMYGGAGNDTLDGGTGNDTAVFSGNRDSYSISGILANRTVASPTEGTDTLLNIEVLQFADGMLVGDTWVPNQDPPPANAVVSSATANLTETDAVLSTSGQLTITDADSPATFQAQTGTAGQYGTFGIGADGQWTYVASSAHNGFVKDQVYTDSFEVVSADGTRTTVTVNITGTNDGAVISGDTTKAVTEGDTVAAISTSGTLTISDVDGAATFVAQSNVAGSNGYGKFTIGANGAWSYLADTAHNEFGAGQTYTDSITVAAADGTTQVVTVTITGTNDGAVLSSATANLTETDAVLSTGGQLTITDVDSEATFRVQTGTVGQYGTFAIGANGQWSYLASSAHNEFVRDQVYSDAFEVFSADGTRTMVTVNITGTDELVPPPPPVNTGNDVVARNGTSGPNTLIGRDNIDNVMKGLGGNDTIKGRGGNDTLSGGSGNDKVYGDSGDDRVNGDSGNDYVNGGSGNDRAYGGSGNDKVYGSAGHDRVYGGSGHDRVDGGSGNDWVYGDSGNDRVVGGTGDDVVNGGSGNDRLYGGTGDDVFVFNTRLGSASTDRKVNFDTVVDFKVRDDSFLLDNSVFKKLGSGTLSNPTQLDKEFFVTGSKARERDDYLIYNKKTGVLSYDADGSGSRDAVEFAQLSKNLKLTYKDFFVI